MKKVTFVGIPGDIVYAYVELNHKNYKGYIRIEKAIINMVSLNDKHEEDYILMTTDGDLWGDSVVNNVVKRVFKTYKEASEYLPTFWKLIKDNYDK